MQMKERLAQARSRWRLLTLYEAFEQGVILVLTALIALVVLFALWNLTVKILGSILQSNFDPSDYLVFQAIFGMIFTVIIALEFKRSLLVVAERSRGVVQVRTVVLLALLAILRKLLIIDLSATDGLLLFALTAAILALGIVYWLIRDQDRRDQDRRDHERRDTATRPKQASDAAVS